MIGFFLPSSIRRQVKAAVLLLLLLVGLIIQRSCEGSPAVQFPTSYCAAATSSDVVAILPVSVVVPAPVGRWVRLLDTARVAGSRSHLARKATPRNRWLPAQPAYLPRLHRRPPQSFLDSLARAAAFRKI